jgi:hypothetical protein
MGAAWSWAVVNMVVPVEADFEWTNIFPPEQAVSVGFWCQELNGVQLGHSAGFYYLLWMRRADFTSPGTKSQRASSEAG